MLPGEARPVAVDRRLGGWPSAHARLALVEAARRAAAGACSRLTAG